MKAERPLVELKNIVKEFYGVRVLDNVNLVLWPGEIHCLVGHNGAGKTVLMKILSGVLQPEAGEIWIYGKKFSKITPRKAKELGIFRIPQDPELVDDLTVAENIFMGDLPGKVLFNPTKLYNDERVLKIIDEMGFKLDLKKLIRDCSRAEKQMAMLIRGLLRRPRVVIFDETTAPLSIREQRAIMSLIKKLKMQGVGVIYISHRIDEVFNIGDTVTVLRNGKVVVTKPVKDLKGVEELVYYIVGEEIAQELKFSRNKQRIDEEARRVLLKVENLSGDMFEDVSLNVREGEIVGVFGVVGSGKTELAETIFGWRKPKRGEIYLRGKKLKINSPKDAIKARIGLVPEERDRLGVIQYMSVSDNIVLPSIARFKKVLRTFLSMKEIRSVVRSLIRRLKIVTRSEMEQVRFLSGGNKQKVVLAKWLASNCDVLMLDEPTKGIDIATKFDVYRLLDEIAREGKGILVFSSDVDEILMISDRIYCMVNGRIVREMEHRDANRDILLNIALGEAYVKA